VKISLPEIRPALQWDAERLRSWPWLAELVDVPADAAPPQAMTRPPADAAGSHGADACAWIERTQRITLRWWQRLAITRQLEYRADGSLCHGVVVESCPRRAGKSVRVRGVALWRMAHPELFGEPQTVIHTGSDVAICREIQRGAWRWAEEVAGWTVSRANGKEAVETPDGDRWLVRAQGAVYGYDVTLGVVDEAWAVRPDTVDEGLEPATLERLSPQLHLTSTAHRRATSLMRTRITEALATDGDALLMLWCAPSGADPGDPAAWRAASPHWSEDRRAMIERKHAAAVAGQADPQADDPDPTSGFCAQYLNVWPFGAAEEGRGEAVVSPESWARLAADVPDRAPDAAAVEDWFGAGLSLALAWAVDGRVVASARPLDGLDEVRPALAALGFRRRITVGASLLDDPALKGVRADRGQGRTGAAVQELGRMIAEDVLRHDGGEHLAAQVLAARTLPGADGPRMTSSAPAAALKAAVWAVADARRPSLGKPRLVVSSG
ncbi:MAG: hypothetical protein ACRCZP_16815, partial [Phycicoccus sp.]